MSRENVELIRGAYEEFEERREAILRILDPDVEWHQATDLPDSRVRRGHDAVAAMISEWVESFDDFRAETEDFIDAGDYVIVPLVYRARLRGTNEEVTLPETHVWKIRDGKAVEVREYRTKESALEALAA